MNPVLQIHNKRLVWLHQGQRVVLSLSEAQSLLTALEEMLPGFEVQLQQENSSFQALIHLDTQICAQNPRPAWRSMVDIECGHYQPKASMQWSLFWRLLSSQECSVVYQLIEYGAFDSLFTADPALSVQEQGIVAERLRALSEPMEWIGPCTFEMGDDSLDAWDFEQPVHPVELTDGFWMGRTPVTQQLYWSVMGTLPELIPDSQGALKPIVQVSWLDALVFCNRLSELTGRECVYRIGDAALTESLRGSELALISCNFNANGYRLPTEAEWECAAKAFQPFQYSGSNDAHSVAWSEYDRVERLPAVGLKMPNALGLYDMSGLVWEWCQDAYDSAFYTRTPLQNPVHTAAQSNRVCRGGSYRGNAMNARVTLRGRAEHWETWSTLGFRIVCKD